MYGFEGECKAKYSERVFKLFSESFSALPLATLIGKKFFTLHGGLFSDDKITLDDIRKLDRHAQRQPGQSGLMMEMLWTDPQKEPGRGPSKRGVGLQFGPDITKRFCEKNGLEAVIRSHEVRMVCVEPFLRLYHLLIDVTSRKGMRQSMPTSATPSFPLPITATPPATKARTSTSNQTTSWTSSSLMLSSIPIFRPWLTPRTLLYPCKSRLCLHISMTSTTNVGFLKHLSDGRFGIEEFAFPCSLIA